MAGLAALILLLPVDRMIDYFLGIDEKLFYETYAVGTVLLVVVIVLQAARRIKAVNVKPADEPAAS